MFLIVYFLFAVEKTLCYGAKGITASIHITRKATVIVHVNLNSYTVGYSYCGQKLLKGEMSIFVKNPLFNQTKRITVMRRI
jgi:hypothetical protein